MRRRKRSKYTWLPVLGSTFGDETQYQTSLFFEELQAPNNDATEPSLLNGGMFCIPLVPDFSFEQDPGNVNISLRDRVEGQDWLLKRLVGKIFCSVRSDPAVVSDSGWPAVIVTAGFFVARAIDEDQTACGLDDPEINVQHADNIQDPWIWRRSWKLGQPASTGVALGSYGMAGAWPQNNAGFSGVLDGPHIDSKVARRITREHRLWWTASAFGVSPGGLTVPAAIGATVDMQMDIRVLGALRRGKNVSSF